MGEPHRWIPAHDEGGCCWTSIVAPAGFLTEATCGCGEPFVDIDYDGPWVTLGDDDATSE